MKILLAVIFMLSAQYALALGDPNYNPLHLKPNEYETVNDMGETTSRMGQWSDSRGYQDQQFMDEDQEMMEEEIKQHKVRDEKILKEEQAPPDTIKVNRE